MKNIFCLGAASLMLCACSEMSNPQVSDFEGNEAHSSVNVISSTVVSDPAQDPYSVENMSRALRKTALAKSRSAEDSADAIQLSFEPNYLYVRFLAEGKKGAYELKQYDSSLVLFKHPLDYKPIKKPVVYKDPLLPDSIIPLFATVPVDYKFGPTKYEIIKELFLVEPDDVSDGDNAVKGLAKKASSKMNELGVSLQEVEWNSLEMTGNLSERLKSYTSERNAGEKPKFAWSFDIDYEANFDSDEFLLEDGHSIYGEDLEIEKNDKHSDWNETFTGNKAKWCVIWTAAYQYYYGNIDGLYRPRQNEWYNCSLDIQVYYKSDSKKYVWWGKSTDASYNYVPTIADWVEINTKDRKPREIYANVMHELTHSAHYENMMTRQWYLPQSVEFSNLPTRLKESYAVGLDYYFQKKRYGNKGGGRMGWLRSSL